MVFHSSLYFTGVIWSITHFWQLSPLKYSINLKDKALKTIIIIIITLTLKNVSKYSFNTCIISVDIKHARCIYMVFIRVYCKLTTVQTKWVGGHLMMVVLSSSFFIFLTHEWVDNVMTLQHNTHGFITAHCFPIWLSHLANKHLSVNADKLLHVAVRRKWWDELHQLHNGRCFLTSQSIVTP